MRLTWRRADGAVCPRVEKGTDYHYIAGEFTQKVYDKLAAYEDAEEQGLLVRLPCKVGDAVFVVEGHGVYKSQVGSITLRDDGLWVNGTFNHFGLVYFSGEIGRNVFITREEAEVALKGETEDV